VVWRGVAWTYPRLCYASYVVAHFPSTLALIFTGYARKRLASACSNSFGRSARRASDAFSSFTGKAHTPKRGACSVAGSLLGSPRDARASTWGLSRRLTPKTVERAPSTLHCVVESATALRSLTLRSIDRWSHSAGPMTMGRLLSLKRPLISMALRAVGRPAAG